jgi:beta-galactosidase
LFEHLLNRVISVQQKIKPPSIQCTKRVPAWRPIEMARRNGEFIVRIVKQTVVAAILAASFVLVGCGAVSKTAGKPTSAEVTAAPVILTQPLSRTVSVGQAATFSVMASGAGQLSYQWQKNGAAISGANASAYSTPAAAISDKGTMFSVTISNELGSITSAAASLTVANSGALVLNASVSALNFGNVEVGGTSTMSVTLTNAGTSDVVIAQVAAAGAGFNTTGLTGLVLKAGESTVLNATFAPSATGSALGRLLISSNATNSPAAISLAGTGTPAPNHTVSLSWVPTGTSATGFNTYSSTVSGGPYEKITTTPVSTPAFTDDSVLPGHTYYYVVTAVNAQSQESAYSSQVTVIVP